MPKKPASNKRLVLELDGLRARLYEAEEALHAIRRGDVDALIVPSEDGEQIFTRKGADRFYRILIENMDEGALTLTAEGVILYANQGFTAMLKTPLEKMIGSSIRRWIVPSDKEIFQALLRHDDTPVPSHGEVMLLASDGTVVPVDLSINNSILQREELPGIYFITSIDLTEKKRLAQESLTASNQAQLALLSVIEDQIQSDKALRSSEEKWRSLVSTMPDYVSLLDRAGRFLFLNHYAEGFTEKDVIGRNVYEYLASESKEAFKENIEKILNTGKSQTFEHTALGDNNVWRHYENYFVPIIEKDRVLSIMCISRDITERKLAEDGMRIALTKYKTLFDCFPMGITVTDERGKIIESNPTAEKLLGVPQEEHNRREINGPEWPIVRLDGTHMPPDEFASVRALKEKRMVEDVEMGITQPDGAIIWISVTAAPLPLEGQGVVVTYSDITERRQAEEELQKKLKELQRWYAVTVDREERVIELKREVNSVLMETGRPGKYGG
jgi:PAS domain S-box-containing protein